MPIWEPFENLRRRNKVLFTIVVAVGVIIFWKGIWELSNVVIDDWLFAGFIDKVLLGGSGELHLFWSNVFSIFIGLTIITLSGLLIEKL